MKKFPYALLFIFVLYLDKINAHNKIKIATNQISLQQSLEKDTLKQQYAVKLIRKSTHLKQNNKEIKKLKELNAINTLYIKSHTLQPNEINNKDLFSYVIFVPFVILIFISTILSVAGFLILFINSATTLKPILDTDYEYIEHIAKNSYKESVRLIKEIYKKKKNKKKLINSNYKKEPEDECTVAKSICL